MKKEKFPKEMLNVTIPSFYAQKLRERQAQLFLKAGKGGKSMGSALTPILEKEFGAMPAPMQKPEESIIKTTTEAPLEI